MRRFFRTGMIMFLLVFPLTALAEITQNDRLLQRPEWDGAVMQQNWIDGAIRFQSWDNDVSDAKAWLAGPTFITSLPDLRSLELGTRLDVIHFDPDNSSSETGLSDIDIWGKYQFLNTPQAMMAAGLLFTLPTGSEDIILPHASGEFNAELFCGGRYLASNTISVIGHVSLRKNNDMDIKIGRFSGEVDGKLQMTMGGGAIFEVTPQLNLQGELNIATEPYDDFDSEILLSAGAEFSVDQNLSLRGGMSFGLDEGSPEGELSLGCAYSF